MQEKQKVTLYLPPPIHRQLKIRAAIEVESMSAMVEKAIAFYLKYPEVVGEVEASQYGKTHQVHICPECETAMVLKDGQMVSLKSQASAIAEEFPTEVETRQVASLHNSSSPEEELVPCSTR